MTQQSAVETLAQVELFAALPAEDLERIAKLAVIRRYPAGDIIVKEGDMGVGFYVVASGAVAVTREGKALGSFGPGGFFGEMALFDNQVRSASVEAVENTECLVLTRWDFAAELNHPGGKTAPALLSVLARRIRQLDEAATH